MRKDDLADGTVLRLGIMLTTRNTLDHPVEVAVVIREAQAAG